MDFQRLQWNARKLAHRTISAPTEWSPADVPDAVNDAYRELCDLERWEFLRSEQSLSTTAGQQRYGLPTPLRTVDSVEDETDSDGGILRPRSGRSRDSIDRSVDDGRPVEYVLRGPETLELWPTPDDVYDLLVHGWDDVQPLSAPTDTPVFDEEYHWAICYLAALNLLERDDPEDGRLERYETRVSAFLDRMRRRYQRQHDHTPLVMGGRRTRVSREYHPLGFQPRRRV